MISFLQKFFYLDINAKNCLLIYMLKTLNKHISFAFICNMDG